MARRSKTMNGKAEVSGNEGATISVVTGWFGAGNATGCVYDREVRANAIARTQGWFNSVRILHLIYNLPSPGLAK